MKDQARVVVIGGGVVGCSVLYHLARAGWTDVLLIERSELTSGSSWHAAGGFHTLNGDPNVAKLQAYTISLYEELEALSGQSCSLHLVGGVMMADTPERMDFLRLAHAKGRYLGMETELITPGEAKEMFPLMDERHFVGALWDPAEGHLDPSGTTHAYAKAARKLGADIVQHNRVIELNQRDDGGWTVVTEKATVIAEHVVNAAGLWAREIGRMVGLELPVLAMEHQYLLTEDMPEVIEYNRDTQRELIHVIDFKGEIYTRQERQGMLLGTYEKAGQPWSPTSTSWDFGQELLPPDLDRIANSLATGFKHFPAYERTGIKQVINGPFTFSPDGNPLLGPVKGLHNYWTACAVMAGFSQAGGVGLALANWMVDGDPGFDVWGMDVARYGDFATPAYTNAKVREFYARRFSIRFPNEELPAARPHMTTPLYPQMLKSHAVMGESWGLEVPMWFAPSKQEAHDIVSFHRSNDFAHVGREVCAVRNSVGIIEIANFAKYQVSGKGAAAFLSNLMANRLPAKGRIILTPMLNPLGKIMGDFTIARAEEERFMIWGSQPAQVYHMRWFEQHQPDDGSVEINCFDQDIVGLSIAGPYSRKVLQKLCDEDVSADSLKFMDYRELDVAGLPCLVNRLTYTGDLGFELWVKPANELMLYNALKQAGEEFGMVNFGMRALLSMRLEKNFPSWSRELRPVYGAFEGGLERLIKLDKGDFIGRSAAQKEFDEGPVLRRCAFIVAAGDADVLGDEPIWARVGDIPLEHIERAHGRGAKRYLADGSVSDLDPDTIAIDGDWRVVGWVTSGGYAHYVKHSMAQGYVPNSLSQDEREGQFEIEILGIRRPARICIDAPFDPCGRAMRS